MSVIILESINYIEHYGLSRKEISPGVYEPVDITHSWNAPHRISNYLLFKLQRHSDHHENSLKPYQTLCSYEKSPQLPQGYAFCILLAFYPKLWFKVMNPLAESYNNKKENKEEKTRIFKEVEGLVKSLLLKNNLIFIGASIGYHLLF